MIRPATSSTTISTLSLHDALPIYKIQRRRLALGAPRSNGSHVRQHRTDLALDDAGRHSVSAAVCRHTGWYVAVRARSEEHTSELQSQSNLVCRLLREKKNWPRRRT